MSRAKQIDSTFVCGNNVERWRIKSEGIIRSGLKDGATPANIAEHIVESILEEAICAVREDEECRKQSDVIRELISNMDKLIDSHATGDIDDKTLYSLFEKLKKKYDYLEG